MNERIRDLKEQALIWAVETLDPDALNDNEWGVAIDEKFAESIVRECIEVIDNTSDNTKLMRVDPYQKIIWAIEEHFGVES